MRNIHISNDNGPFTFYVDVFFPLSLPRLFSDLTVYMSSTVSCKKQERLTLREHQSSPPVFYWVGSVLFIFSLSFCVVLLCVFTFLDPCYCVLYDFRIKTMFDMSLPPVVCRRAYVLFGSLSKYTHFFLFLFWWHQIFSFPFCFSLLFFPTLQWHIYIICSRENHHEKKYF